MAIAKQLGKTSITALLLLGVGCGGITDKIEAAIQKQIEKEATALFEEAAKQYPTYLAVASPFAMTAATQIMAANQPPAGDGSVKPLAEEPPKIREYEDMTRRIHAMLMETQDAKRCHFPPGMLLHPSRNAACYGPNVAFEKHPDSPGAASDGSLPHGDTGMWTAVDAKTGQACAAEQLNAGLESVGRLTTGALMGLAGMICTARVNDISIDQPEIDLLAPMNALGMPNVTFTKAILRHPGEKQFSYALSFDITGDKQHRIAIEMEHAPGDVTTAYAGKVWYRISGDHARFCPPGSEGESRNGTLVYDRTADALEAQVKGGVYCGKEVDGRNANGELDPAVKRTPQSETGWQNMFDILAAKFDPKTLAGDYSYIWQAGNRDNNTRAFNVHIDGDQDDVTGGDAFFGYGKDIAESDGSIQGFICNWAGPGNVHTLQPFAQHQKISKSGDKFVADVSEIAYAPTNSCGYDGTGAFRFDSDGNGTVDTDPAVPFVSELLGVTDADANGQLDEIVATGFALPKF